MKVENELVYKVISIDKAKELKEGDVIPIPTERDNYGLQMKIDAEELLENIRKKSYENLPSRKSVLFVFPSEVVANDWMDLMYPRDDYDYVLCTLRITGDIFWCDQDNYTNAGQFVNPLEKQNYAIKYWDTAGDTYDTFEIPEGLFRGKAVIERIEEKHHIALVKDNF